MSKRPGEQLAINLAPKRAFVGDVAPGREYVEPKIYQQPSTQPAGGGGGGGGPRKASGCLAWRTAPHKLYMQRCDC